MIIGKKYQSNNYGEFTVLSKVGNVLSIKFTLTGTIKAVFADNASRGEVKDRMYPIVHGVGFIGLGEYSSRVEGVKYKPYDIWTSMLERCYSEKSRTKHPTYAGCTVCTEWHNFQNFAQWYEANYPDDGNAYHLDKDIRFEGNKIYSPATCLFTTQAENTAKALSKRYTLKSPVGEIVEIYNMAEFCRGSELLPSAMIGVARGKRNIYKGWTKA